MAGESSPWRLTHHRMTMMEVDPSAEEEKPMEVDPYPTGLTEHYTPMPRGASNNMVPKAPQDHQGHRTAGGFPRTGKTLTYAVWTQPSTFLMARSQSTGHVRAG